MVDKTDLKVIGTVLLSAFTAIFGEVDKLFSLLLVLMACDIISGIADACYNKTLSSDRMRKGIFRKAGIFIVIAVCVRIDLVILEQIPEGIIIGDRRITVRMFFLAYFSICELLSIFENLDILGVPIPKALKNVLKKAKEITTETENPIKLIDKLKEWLDLLRGNKTTPKDEKTEQETQDEGNENG